MLYELKILSFAEIEAMESIIFHGGDNTKFRRIGLFAWLLRSEDETILVDTGISDIDVVNRTRVGPKAWKQRSEQTIESNLNRLQIDPESVTSVILTHSHYDHISNIPLFHGADVYFSRKEYLYLMEETEEQAHLVEVKKHITLLKKNRKLHLVEKNLQINDQIEVQWVGGHTPGSQVVFAETDLGRCLMTGDAVFLLDNINNRVPIGLTCNERESMAVLGLCHNFSGLCLPSHDLSVLNQFNCINS